MPFEIDVFYILFSVSGVTVRWDSQVVMTAVAENGIALKYAAPELQDDCGLAVRSGWSNSRPLWIQSLLVNLSKLFYIPRKYAQIVI